MGANESRPGAGGRFGASDSHRKDGDDNDGETEDLYHVLQVEVDATSDEIKKAFKKQALIHHPDKNPNNVEQATRRFAKIQQAYEVLSDESERAFYDRHRDEILNDRDPGYDLDPSNLKEARPSTSPFRPGVTVKQLLKFFDSTIWKDDFSNSETSFYGIYGNLFHLLAAEEKAAREDSLIIYPSFGTSESKYDEDYRGTRALKYFYASWSNFSTQKSFEWIEVHQTSHQIDRRLKRLIEKENQRARDVARREYNETVRSLVSFVKKRDPRFSMSAASNPEKWRAQELQRIKKELKEAAERRAKEREEEAQRYREQAWQRQKSDPAECEDEGELSEEEEEITEEEVDQVNDWYCAACGKNFNSQGAWDNHERSKKHKQNAYRLRKQMVKEDTELLLSSSGPKEPQSLDSDLPKSPEAEPEDNCNLGITSNENQKAAEMKRPPEDEATDPQVSQNVPSCPPETLDTSILNDLSLGSETFENLDSKFGSESEKDDSQDMSQKRKGMNKRKPKKNIDLGKSSEGGKSLVAEQEASESPKNPPDQKVEMTKREKRRAKEALRKQSSEEGSSKGPSKVESCNVCQARFPSKSKLFEHIRSEGHASAEPTLTHKSGSGPKSGKKKVR